MVRMSRMVEYSIMLLTLLARLKEEEKMSAREISNIYKLPHPTVSKILKILAKESIIKSIQGPKGGYKLIKDANKINLKMLIDIFDGKSNIVSCLTNKAENMCEFLNTCSAKNTMTYVDKEINKIFEDITLKKLMSKS